MTFAAAPQWERFMHPADLVSPRMAESRADWCCMTNENRAERQALEREHARLQAEAAELAALTDELERSHDVAILQAHRAQLTRHRRAFSAYVVALVQFHDPAGFVRRTDLTVKTEVVPDRSPLRVVA